MSVGQLRSQRHGSNHFRSIDAAQTIDYEPLRYICILGKCWGCSLLSSAFFMLLKLVALAMSAHSSGDAFTPRNSPSLVTTLTGSFVVSTRHVLIEVVFFGGFFCAQNSAKKQVQSAAEELVS